MVPWIPNVTWPLMAVAVVAAFLVYAKRHPQFANRWSRLTQARCERCEAEHDWRESGLCLSCEIGEAGELAVFDQE